MTRITRILLAVMAILAIAAVPALAGKPADPGKSKSAPHGKHKGFGKGVTKLKSGTTTLDVDAGTLAALTGAGFGVTPAVPATATGSTFSFPITKGRVHLVKGKKKKTTGYINHSGGITFTKGAVSATASDLRILLSSSKKVRVFASLGGKNTRLLDLKNLAVADGKITADALLAKQGGDALNAVFGVTLFTPGLAMGKVTVTPGS
jgi:hypothetical protein